MRKRAKLLSPDRTEHFDIGSMPSLRGGGRLSVSLQGLQTLKSTPMF